MSVYSLEFRPKVVSAYHAGNTSIRKVAKRFMITPRTVYRWVCQYEQTGHLQPQKAGHKQPSPLEAHAQTILELVEAQPDWTLKQSKYGTKACQ
jgi:transposase